MQAGSLTAEPQTAPIPIGSGVEARPRVSYRLLLVALWLLPLIAAVPGLLILVAACAAVPWWRRTRPQALPLGWTWALLLAATAVSAAWSIRPELSWPGVLLCGAYLATVWVVARAFRGSDGVGAALHALFWGMIPWGVLGVVLVAAKQRWVTDWGPLHIELGTWDNRANSVFWHPNILSGYILFALAAGLAHARGRWALYGPALAVLAVCQILTQSRSGWVGTGVLAFVYLGLTIGAAFSDRERPPSGRPWLKAGLSLVAVLVALPFAWPRLLTLFDPAYGSNINRLRVWDSARDMIAARPLFGWGPSTWIQAYPQFRNPEEFENLPHAHSMFLHLGAEYGLIMMALLLVLVGTAAYRALATTWADPARRAMVIPLAAALAGYLVMGLFEFTFSEGRNAIAFFTTVGLLAALADKSNPTPVARPSAPEARSSEPAPGS